MANYTEQSALNALKRINGINIDNNNKIIKIGRGVAGNSTWSKIDFLTKYCGYGSDIIRNKEEDETANDIISHTPVEREKFTKHKVKP